jgi:hypothetical protein
MGTLRQAAADSVPLAKLFVIGDTKSGKTTLLLDLILGGYFVHVVDVDCKIYPSYLYQRILATGKPELLDRLDFVQYRDEYIMDPIEGSVPKHPAVAFERVTAITTKWEDGTRPCEWGPNHVFVVDTLNRLSDAAFAKNYLLIKNSNKDHKVNDMRQVYKAAQMSIERYIAGLWSDKFNTNVVILSHIKDVDLEFTVTRDGQKVATKTKGFPATVGNALSQTIGGYTNDLFQIEISGHGPSEKRMIRTQPNPRTEVGSSLVGLPPQIPSEGGLLTIFKKLRGEV